MDDIINKFPNIKFFIQDGKPSTVFRWRKDPKTGRDREALPSEMPNEFLDEQCGLVNRGEKFFVCYCCGHAKTKEEYQGFDMAAKYCKECTAASDKIKAALEQSSQPGFYD